MVRPIGNARSERCRVASAARARKRRGPRHASGTARSHARARDRPQRLLFFTQTCGLPLFTSARDHFTVLGAPAYRVPGAVGSEHRSFIVVRARSGLTSLEDLRGKRFAINQLDSNCGMNLPRRLFAPLARGGRFFSSTTVTGSHAASARAITAGDADAAAIDCVTFALLRRYRRGDVASLDVIAETTATPTPPLVTARSRSAHDVDAIRTGLRALIADPSLAAVREALFLDDITFCDEIAYASIMRFDREARDLGYPILA